MKGGKWNRRSLKAAWGKPWNQPIWHDLTHVSLGLHITKLLKQHTWLHTKNINLWWEFGNMVGSGGNKSISCFAHWNLPCFFFFFFYLVLDVWFSCHCHIFYTRNSSSPLFLWKKENYLFTKRKENSAVVPNCTSCALLFHVVLQNLLFKCRDSCLNPCLKSGIIHGIH